MTFFDVEFDKIYPEPSSEQFALVFFNDLWRQLHVYSFSLLLTFLGKHRVGKSLAAVAFSYIIDPSFEKHLEERVVYTSKDFLRETKKIRYGGFKCKGRAIIKDEAGTGDLSSSKWYEESAKLVNTELQAIGYLNPLISFVTQSFSFVNTTARKLSHAILLVDRKTNKCSMIKPYWIEGSPFSSSYYHRYPLFSETHDGIKSNTYKINMITLGLPPKDIVDRYIQHSKAYKDKLHDECSSDLDSFENEKTQRKKKDIKALNKMVEDVIVEPFEFSTRHKKNVKIKKFDEYLIMHHFNLGSTEARIVKALAEKKYFGE